MSSPTPLTPVLPATTIAFTIVRDGFLPGWLPAYRVVTVTVDKAGKAKVEASPQKYLVKEAQSIVEDLQRVSLGI